MTYEEMNATLKEAQTTFGVCDAVAARVALLLVGRLRQVGSTSILSKLKKELASFNMTTGRWVT